jgi:hypothetical protein
MFKFGEKLNNENESELAYPPNKKYLSEDVIKEVKLLENFSLYKGIEVFPIHPFDEKKIFLNEIFQCPNMKKIREDLIKNSNLSLIYNKIDEEYGEALQTYFNYTDRKFIHDFFKIISITDNYISNIIHGKNLYV